MSDPELIALAALVNCEAVTMQGDNEQRRMNGECPMWREGCGLPQYATMLENELYRRKQEKDDLDALGH